MQVFCINEEILFHWPVGDIHEGHTRKETFQKSGFAVPESKSFTSKEEVEHEILSFQPMQRFQQQG